jgi:hypothetical protein
MHQIGALIACAIGGSVWLSVPVLPLPVVLHTLVGDMGKG